MYIALVGSFIAAIVCFIIAIRQDKKFQTLKSGSELSDAVKKARTVAIVFYCLGFLAAAGFFATAQSMGWTLTPIML